MKMTFTKVRSFGAVTLECCKENKRYYLRYRVASAPGKWPYARKTLGHKNLAKATKAASDFAEAMNQNPEIAELARTKHTLQQALDEAIQNSRSRDPQHRSNLKDFADYFKAFVARQFPSVRYWHQISPEVVSKYVDYLRNGDNAVAAKTAKNYVSIATLTSRFMVRMYPKLRYAQLTIGHPLLHSEAAEKQYLSASELRTAIAIAAATGETYAELALLLSGLCGLRLHEVMRLKSTDFDFGRSCVEIRKSKNAQSLRVLPLPKQVTERVWGHFKTLGEQEWLMTRRDSKTGHIEQAAEYTVTKCMRRLLSKCAAETKNANFTLTAPKNAGRKTWMNLAERAGVMPWRRDAYAGQGGTTVAYRHYVDRNSLLVLEELRRDVVEPIEAYWSKVPAAEAVAA